MMNNQKKKPDKAKSYLDGQGQSTKKKEMTHIKEKKEERVEQQRIH